MSAVAFPEAFRFHLWLVSQAESNALEGQNDTAEKLRDLARLVLDFPAEFEAYYDMSRLDGWADCEPDAVEIIVSEIETECRPGSRSGTKQP